MEPSGAAVPCRGGCGPWNLSIATGELLRPDAYSDQDIARIKANSSYPTLYQQCAGSKSEIIAPADFPTFSVQELPQRTGIVLSVDANQCKGAKNSFSVIQVWMASDKHFFLLDQWREQCNYDELWTAFRRLCSKHNPVRVLMRSGKRLSVDPGRKTSSPKPFGRRSQTRPAVKAGALGGTDRNNQGRPHPAALACRFRQRLYRRIHREQADGLRPDRCDGAVSGMGRRSASLATSSASGSRHHSQSAELEVQARVR